MYQWPLTAIVMASERALRHVTASPPAELQVLACALPRHQQAFLLDGLKRQAQCRFVDTFEEMDRALAGTGLWDAVVVAPQDARGQVATGIIERLARERPGTGIVVFFPARGDMGGSPREFALAGAHQLVFEGVNNTAATLAQAVTNAGRECTADIVFAALQPLVPPPLHAMVHAVVSRPHEVSTVTRLAAALAVHRKTLVNRCTRAGFVSPAALIGWCRLAVVGYLLERTGATVESIALSLEYPSHTALRNLAKRYTRLRATEIRRHGGLSVVVEAFRRRLEPRRAEGPVPQPTQQATQQPAPFPTT